MTLALLELALAAGLLYAGIKCVKFVPLLAGNEEPGDNCTGSIVAVIAAYITTKVGSGILNKIFTGAAGAAAGAAGKAIAGRGGSGGTTPTEPTPAPAPPDVIIPEIPASFAAGATGSSGQPVNVTQPVAAQAAALHTL